MVQFQTQRVAPHHPVACPDFQERPSFLRAKKFPPKNRILLLLAFQNPRITGKVKEPFSSFSVQGGNPCREKGIDPSLHQPLKLSARAQGPTRHRKTRGLNGGMRDVSVPGFLEPWAVGLPRFGLRWLESRVFPGRPSAQSVPAEIPAIRIALVKSELAAHIYTRPGSSSDLSALVASTPKMFGPTSLFTLFQADFMIVKASNDPECNHWKESFAGDPDPAATQRLYEAHRDLRPVSGPEPHPSQGEIALDPAIIDWSRYDAVFSHDLALPRRIVERHRRVFWSYWIGETGTPSYKKSYRGPLAGYHCFLNGGSRNWRVRPSLRSHVLEFPYIFQSHRDHFGLGARPASERRGVLLERVTSEKIPAWFSGRIPTGLPLISTAENAAERLSRLHACRYFLQMGPQTFWGNGLQEAVAAGCLALADPATMPNNASLLLPELGPRSWPEAAELLRRLEEEPAWREELQRRQAERAEWLLVRRPLRDWLNRWTCFRKEDRR